MSNIHPALIIYGLGVCVILMVSCALLRLDSYLKICDRPVDMPVPLENIGQGGVSLVRFGPSTEIPGKESPVDLVLLLSQPDGVVETVDQATFRKDTCHNFLLTPLSIFRGHQLTLPAGSAGRIIIFN